MSKVVKPGNEPWVSNYPPLQKWLDEHEARCLWQIPYGGKSDPVAYVECWKFASGRLAILFVWSHGFGWEIYTPAGTNKVDETLADAEQRLVLGRRPKED